MTTALERLEHRQLRAPRTSGSALVDPPFEAVAGLVAENLHRRAEYSYDLQGRSLSEVARQARRELLLEAYRWTAAYRDVDSPPTDESTTIFLAGHQPQLFHPGVWLKNFALGTLAQQLNAVAVNLLIDTDTIKKTTVAVPGGSVARPQVAEIPIDRAGQSIPFEERRIVDRELFAEFGRRAAEQIAPLVPDPLIRTYWPMAVGRVQQTDNLGACLAQSRHQLEGRWGLRTLEIPESRVCQSEAFGWFMAHLLASLPRLWAVYNDVVRQCRRANRIRSAAHPVPNLASDGRWLEAPFWIWTVRDPQRRRLFVRHARGGLVLSDRHHVEFDLPISPDDGADRAVQRLGDLARGGVKIRGRALITTLWARLVLGDLFLHGIGGAKYDQLTDALITRFFGLAPPRFLVLSATLHLPIARRRVVEEDVRAIEHRLRELTYHPELYVDPYADVPPGASDRLARLIAAKRRWIRTKPTASGARTRCRQIRRINEALQPWVAPQRRRLLADRQRTEEALRAESVLSWREYGFCLFPEKTLRNFLVELLPKNF